MNRTTSRLLFSLLVSILTAEQAFAQKNSALKAIDPSQAAYDATPAPQATPAPPPSNEGQNPFGSGIQGQPLGAPKRTLANPNPVDYSQNPAPGIPTQAGSGWSPQNLNVDNGANERRVSRLEQLSFGSAYPEHEVEDRLDHLETEVFSKKNSGMPTDQRLARLESKLLGQTAFGQAVPQYAGGPANSPPAAGQSSYYGLTQTPFPGGQFQKPNNAYSGSFQQPPQQQSYAQPPQQRFGQYPQQGFGQPPQQQSYAQPPQQSYGQYPQQGFGQPPQQQSFGQAPQQQSFGQPPQQSFGQPPQQSFGQAPQQSFAQPPPQKTPDAPARTSILKPSGLGSGDRVNTDLEGILKGITYKQASGDYFAAISKFAGNHVARWTSFPILIHLPQGSPPNWNKALEEAISAWGKYIPVRVAALSETADVEVAWINHLPPRCLGQTNLEVFNGRMRVTVYLLRPSYYLANTPEKSLRKVAEHELGHAIGIFGHSNDPSDAMYSLEQGSPKLNTKYSGISQRDINTLKRIYESEALPPGYQSPNPLGWSLLNRISRNSGVPGCLKGQSSL